MRVHVYWSWEAPDTPGASVVVDVYAATTNIASFLARGAKKVFLVNNETVFSVKNRYPNARIIGESLEFPKRFFYASNKPSDATSVDVGGKVIIFMSNNGTRVVQEVIRKGANPVVTASFANVDAVAHWIRYKKLKNIAIVAAGEMAFSDSRVMEDKLCATLLRDILLQKHVDIKKQMKTVRDFMLSIYQLSGASDPNLQISLSLNAYPVVPLCIEESSGIVEVVEAIRK